MTGTAGSSRVGQMRVASTLTGLVQYLPAFVHSTLNSTNLVLSPCRSNGPASSEQLELDDEGAQVSSGGLSLTDITYVMSLNSVVPPANPAVVRAPERRTMLVPT